MTPRRFNRFGKDVARIQDQLRIKGPFDLPHDMVGGTKLLLGIPAATQTKPMFTRDRAAHRKRLGVKFFREPVQHVAHLGIGQIHERSNVQLPVPGVRENGRRNLLLFQNVLSRRQKTGQGLWRDGDVFDEGNRPLGTFQPVKRRDYASCQFPKAISLIGFQSDVVIERFPVTSLDLLNEIFQLFV